MESTRPNYKIKYAAVSAENEKLKEQRDELLKAINSHEAQMCFRELALNKTNSNGFRFYNEAKIAIEKVTGKQD